MALVAIITALLLSADVSNVRAGTLSCTVATSCASGVVIFRMYSTSNSHAELASQSNYPNLVCCSGVVGLGNTCSGNYAVALKLAKTTNAHAEQNTQSNYANNACISVPTGGTVSIGYQASNCTGYDTTLASMAATTNAHIGDGSAYTTKVCATASGGSGTLAADIVDAGGTTVASPGVTFSSVNYSFDSAQTSTGTLGTSSQKIRVTNGTATATWSLTMAATGGASAPWTNGVATYPFNGSSSANGQLTVNPTGATVTPQSGCTTTGITLGSSGTFSGGLNTPQTIASAGSTAGTNCYWDVTNVSLSQTVPVLQSSGTYTIGMTISAQ